jgi:hypothetical protein
MLVGGTYQFRAGVDQGDGLKRFQAWQPPAGFTFQGHWTTADGMGGIFIAEVDSAAAAFEASEAFADMVEFHIVPVLDINESVPISARVFDWIDSVS